MSVKIDKKSHFVPKEKKDYGKIRCYCCKQEGHKQFQWPNKDKVKHESALFGEALLFTNVDVDLWIADTGSSHHLTNLKDCYSSYSTFDEPKSIILGNKKLTLAYGQGDMQIESLVDGQWSQHVLKDAWYAPEVAKNLLSIPSAADKGLEYWLDKTTCRLIRNGETVVTGKRHGGL